MYAVQAIQSNYKGEHYMSKRGNKQLKVLAACDAASSVNSVIDYEDGQQSHDDTIAMFQSMINSGMAWKLQGSYGREAMSLIESGQCILGEVGHNDYYGNYVPSRFEVKAGTKGSVEYQQARN
jgi:hypothetical protein